MRVRTAVWLLAIPLALTGCRRGVTLLSSRDPYVADMGLAVAHDDCGGVEDSTGLAWPGGAPGAPVRPGNCLDPESFGFRSEGTDGDDDDASLFAERGWTVRRQLEQDRVQEQFEEIYEAMPSPETAQVDGPNVAATYLLRHWSALRLAHAAGAGRGAELTLNDALDAEATAQDALRCAFNSAHLLLPRRNTLPLIGTGNVSVAHQRLGETGAYVINALGDAWLTQGHASQFWSTATLIPLLETEVQSLHEVLLTYYAASGDTATCRRLLTARHGGVASRPPPVSPARPFSCARCFSGLHRSGVIDELPVRGLHPGTTMEQLQQRIAGWLNPSGGQVLELYLDQSGGLPSLWHLPWPVTAAWSVPATEAPGASRHHYPQLEEEGGYDPELPGVEHRFVPKRSQLPEWVIAPWQRDPSVPPPPGLASLNFTQERHEPATWRGPYLSASGGVSTDQHESARWVAGAFGVGLGVHRVLGLLEFADGVEAGGGWRDDSDEAFGFARVTGRILLNSRPLGRRLSIPGDLGITAPLEQAQWEDVAVSGSFGVGLDLIESAHVGYWGMTLDVGYRWSDPAVDGRSVFTRISIR